LNCTKSGTKAKATLFAGSARCRCGTVVYPLPFDSRITHQKLGKHCHRNQHHHTQHHKGITPPEAGYEPGDKDRHDRHPDTCADLDHTGHHAPFFLEPSCHRGEHAYVLDSHASTAKAAVGLKKKTELVDLCHQNIADTEENATPGHDEPGTVAIAQIPRNHADNPVYQKTQRCRPGQGGPQPAELGEQRIEKDPETVAGTPGNRLNEKTGGDNDVAVEKTGSWMVNWFQV